MKFFMSNVELEGEYRLYVGDNGFNVYNKKDDLVYCEDDMDFWKKYEYNEQGQETYYESSSGYWERKEYNSKGNLLYYIDSDGDIEDYREKEMNIEKIEEEYDYRLYVGDNLLYYIDSDGDIEDYREKEMNIEKIEEEYDYRFAKITKRLELIEGEKAYLFKDYIQKRNDLNRNNSDDDNYVTSTNVVIHTKNSTL